jgi:NAD-specific glutamate dehydrogenase
MLAKEMPWPEEQQAKSNPPAQPRNPGDGRHRSRRGGRGRNPRQTAKVVATTQIASPALEKKETQTIESAAAISKVVDEVRQIVESLEQALQQMEEVLRLVEVAERQKITDEHEIESLRRALRRIQQPRSGQPERSQPND